MYKLIAIDCDGTLLNSKRELSERTVNAIKIAIDSGIKIVLASARPAYRLKQFLKPLGLLSSDQYLISFNGGLVCNNTYDEILFSKAISTDLVFELIKFGHQFKTKVFIYAQDCIYSDVDEKTYQRNNPDVNFKVIDFNDLDFSKIPIYKAVYLNSAEDTKRIRASLPNEFLSNFETSSSVPQYIEFVSRGITKSHALECIGDKLGIKASEMVAFGDQENDLAMLQYVGYSVAMGNATDEIKKQVDHITASNDEDGVALVIEKII